MSRRQGRLVSVTQEAVPGQGSLVEVRGQQSVISGTSPGVDGSTATAGQPAARPATTGSPTFGPPGTATSPRGQPGRSSISCTRKPHRLPTSMTN
jgi:hypothetical protein